MEYKTYSQPFDFYLLKRICEDNGSMVDDHIICRFANHGSNTDKIDQDGEFQNCHRVFSFSYDHKFNDNNYYQYSLSPIEVIEEIKVLANNSREGWKAAVAMALGAVPDFRDLCKKLINICSSFEPCKPLSLFSFCCQ
ncbi:hypothetical protein [Pseudobacter ginsenosidimutans]|uniref:hypothetical protein n=1 Tax=Pseudobacter ginsenosidimutans TaxID=661488 RepID=UPI00102D7589|nr:hypothetical protein [Pseudobacter ginsenosidimutans]QEC44339.1 hypothetical protein FSB84_22665 [Pseudobacter ginsenosidimutans]